MADLGSGAYDGAITFTLSAGSPIQVPLYMNRLRARCCPFSPGSVNVSVTAKTANFSVVNGGNLNASVTLSVTNPTTATLKLASSAGQSSNGAPLTDSISTSLLGSGTPQR